MSEKHKAILLAGNAAITEGRHEAFLEFCTENTLWHFMGEQTLNGKEAVRAYMAATYKEPPVFSVHHLIADAEFLTVVGEITLKDDQGKPTHYSYCDVWRFENDKLAELKAFVVRINDQ